MMPRSPTLTVGLLSHHDTSPTSTHQTPTEAYKRDAGLTDWCYTVGHEYFGDYVAARSAKVSRNGIHSFTFLSPPPQSIDPLSSTPRPSFGRCPLRPFPNSVHFY